MQIRPHVGVLSVFEAVDYKAWFALAEFVDNAIQSWSGARGSGLLGDDDAPLRVDVQLGAGQDGHISVSDNAAGIPAERFASAFEIGKPPPDASGLSVYGIGMKSASAWFARRMRLTTTAAGEPVERVVDFDFPRIVESGVEHLDVLERPAPPGEHGTEVVLTGLRNPVHTKTHAKVREHLSSIYRNFLRSGELVLTYQGDPLGYADPEDLVAPFFRDQESPPVAWRKSVDLTLSSGERVNGFAALRRTGRAAGSGFSLYRGRRVITGLDDDPWRPTEIFGYGNSYRSQRVYGELHLDNVKVAYSKNGFIWQASGEELVERLREALDAEPLPLLRQAEGYRAREPEPRQREAASRALDAAGDAIQAAVDAVPALAAEQAREETPAQLPSPSQEVAQRAFDLTHRGRRWQVRVELAQDPDAVWLAVSDTGDPTDQRQPRTLGVRLNLASAFMRQFGGVDAAGTEGVLRVAAALALAVVVCREQGLRFTDTLLRHVNQLLGGSMAR